MIEAAKEPTPPVTVEDIRRRCAHIGGIDLRQLTDANIGQFVATICAGWNARFYRVSRGVNQLWYRGRTCDTNDGYANIRECLYRNDTPSDGRAHLRGGRPVFYGSWNVLTVWRELRPRPEQFVHIVAMRPRVGVVLACSAVGEFAHVHNTGASYAHGYKAVEEVQQILKTADDHEQLLLFDSFVAHEFRHPGEERYRLTGTIATPNLNAGLPMIYPSVTSFGAANIALNAETFDDSCEVLWTQVWAGHYLGYDMYKLYPTARFSCDFAPNGSIDWGCKKTIQTEYTVETGTRVVGDYEGWRVPH